MRADPAAVERATAHLGEQESVPGLLSATARTLVELADAAACTISRVIGDLLVDLVHHRAVGEPARLGHGYLISDYPLTRDVLERLEPRTVFVEDAYADPAEVKLLREMSFDALLMTAIAVDRKPWGLVEVYGDTRRRFEDADVAVVADVVSASAARLKYLEARERGQI
jgi:hypothetical protein